MNLDDCEDDELQPLPTPPKEDARDALVRLANAFERIAKSLEGIATNYHQRTYDRSGKVR